MDKIEPSAALATALANRRERELGLSREQLAERLGWTPDAPGGRSRSGWSPRTLVRIEKGQRGLRSGEEVNALARSLDLTPGELIGRIAVVDSATHVGDPGGLISTISRVGNPDQRALLLRLVADIEAVASQLAGDPAPEDPPGSE